MNLFDKVNEWDSEISEDSPNYPKYNLIYDEINYKERNFFKDYTPALSPDHLGFSERLEDWIGNVASDEDQKALFEFVLNIDFISHEDMMSLFSSAFSGPIKRWIIDIHDIKFDDALDEKLNFQLYNKTWYTSLTDMNLGDFYRVNRIEGHSIRSDFKTLVELGDSDKLERLLKDKGYDQIVLIEDFIGSGLSFDEIAEKFPPFLKNIPILFAPQIICSSGYSVIKSYLDKIDKWKIEPVLIIEKEECLYPGKDLTKLNLQKQILDISKSFCAECEEQATEPYDDFDLEIDTYGCGLIGALIVLYSNTPDNTMPLIWETIGKWSALFPRSSREVY